MGYEATREKKLFGRTGKVKSINKDGEIFQRKGNVFVSDSGTAIERLKDDTRLAETLLACSSGFLLDNSDNSSSVDLPELTTLQDGDKLVPIVVKTKKTSITLQQHLFKKARNSVIETSESENADELSDKLDKLNENLQKQLASAIYESVAAGDEALHLDNFEVVLDDKGEAIGIKRVNLEKRERKSSSKENNPYHASKDYIKEGRKGRDYLSYLLKSKHTSGQTFFIDALQSLIKKLNEVNFEEQIDQNIEQIKKAYPGREDEMLKAFAKHLGIDEKDIESTNKTIEETIKDKFSQALKCRRASLKVTKIILEMKHAEEYGNKENKDLNSLEKQFNDAKEEFKKVSNGKEPELESKLKKYYEDFQKYNQKYKQKHFKQVTCFRNKPWETKTTVQTPGGNAEPENTENNKKNKNSGSNIKKI